MLATLLCTWVLALAPQGEMAGSVERIECGPLAIEVGRGETALLFHVVDQLSAWDGACHGQYRRHLSLSAEDEAQLRRYADVRVNRRWGQGLEQTFYAPLTLDDAIRAGVDAGHVSAEEAAAIRPVLEHFAPRVAELSRSMEGKVASAFERVDHERLTHAAERLARFTGVETLTVWVFPLASPEPGGGGADGGLVRWEIGPDGGSFYVLVHELAHAFFLQRGEALGTLVERTPGLSHTLLGEGLASAVAPGLYEEGDGDLLRHQVQRARERGEGWKEGDEREKLFALGLRPLLRDAFESGRTLDDVLPEVRSVFLALREIEQGPPGASRPPGPPRLVAAGPSSKIVRERLLGTEFRYWIHCIDHRRESYDKVIPELGRGDLLVLCVAGTDQSRVPEAYASLSPLTRAQLDARLATGGTIAERKRTEAGLEIVLLAAPTKAELENLTRETPLLER